MEKRRGKRSGDFGGGTCREHAVQGERGVRRGDARRIGCLVKERRLFISFLFFSVVLLSWKKRV